jgi:hypothetical protein
MVTSMKIDRKLTVPLVEMVAKVASRIGDHSIDILIKL